MIVTTKVLVKHEPLTAGPGGRHDVSPRARTHERHVRRLQLTAAAWAIGATVVTALCVYPEWDVNGAFESIGFDGDAGQWNPTLWAVLIGVWSLVVGIMALGVYFERPVLQAHDLRTEHVAQLEFHVTAWIFGMLVLTPVWALIEWQDNGAFERWSRDSQPGSWEPWILYVGVLWALGIAILTGIRLLRDRQRA